MAEENVVSNEVDSESSEMLYIEYEDTPISGLEEHFDYDHIVDDPEYTDYTWYMGCYAEGCTAQARLMRKDGDLITCREANAFFKDKGWYEEQKVIYCRNHASLATK